MKVHDNAVVGFEPWYEFPFNEGKLCPKGVKRYLQGSHPDRLLHPMERDPSAPGGFRPVTWDHALDRVVAEVRRIQQAHGDDAFAMLSGVSLTNEKSYLIGKFARLALHTANLDYNGRFCMVSAGVGNKKALGLDRNPNPWSDIPLADVVWIAGTNVAETFPITTSYIWRARDRGAKLIVQDPRVVPLARTADLFLGVRPGTDSALFGAVLHELIRRDLLDHEFIDAHTVDFDAAAAAAAEMTPAVGRRHHRRAGRRASSRPPSGGGRRQPGCCSTPAASSSSRRARRTCWRRSTSAWPPASSASPAAACRRSPARATARAAVSTATSATSSPATATSATPSTGRTPPPCGGARRTRSPAPGSPPRRSSRRSIAGEIKGLLSICFNPSVSAPNTTLTAEAFDRLEFYAVIDFFLSESGRHADIVLPGSLHEEDEGTVTTGEGRIVKINKAVDPPGEARADWEILGDIARRLGKGHYFPYTGTEQIFEELRLASAGGTADYRGATWQRIRTRWACSGPSPRRATRARRACSRGAASPIPTARPASTPCRSASPPRSSTTSTRCG